MWCLTLWCGTPHALACTAMLMVAALECCNPAQDGSSNIDCGVSIGTIYGIYKRGEGCDANVDCVLRVRPSSPAGCLPESIPCEPGHLLSRI